MKKITTCLWFDTQAEQAAKFYVKIFKNSKITRVNKYPAGSPYKAGSVMTVEFKLNGQSYVGLNGGPHFKFTPAISLWVDCKDQKEVDFFYKKLTADGGQPSQCGWVTDKFGLSWQVVPDQLIKLTTGKDKAKAARVFGAMMKMQKIIIADLEAAAKARA